MRTSYAILFAGLLALLPSAAAQASQIYTWTDDSGVTHFSAEPPVGVQSEKLSGVRPPPSPAATAEAETGSAPEVNSQQPSQAEIDNRVRKEIAQQQAELQQYCTQLRTQLSQLSNNPRLLAEIDGETVRLTEEQRQQRIQQTQQKISELCE